MKVFTQDKYANNLWNIMGSFGEFTEEVTKQENGFCAENGKIRVISEITKDKNGVCVRTGKVKNISDADITLYTIASKFSLDGGEYEVYSQYNGWQNESMGDWQPLVSSVSVRSKSVRMTSSAAPFMVLWANQQNRGTAFHLNPYSAWEMRISRLYLTGEAAMVEVELGVLSEGLNLTLTPGEEVDLPEIIYYDVFNKTDMDCWKLHSYLNRKYPRKVMPVTYNTWLYKFDRFHYEDVLEQIEKAEKLGVEYFVIDAGWFGNGDNWWQSRGDWVENMSLGFRGRMDEIPDIVRSHGMKFGFWLEPECASPEAEVVKNNPDYFLHSESCFIDFAKDEARQQIFDKVSELIDRFGAEYVKFDFNADLVYDKYNSGFIKYAEGHTKFIKMLRDRYPNLYIENCASGGMRMAIRDGKLYDSFWVSDNQSPYSGLDIFKNTILRLAPQWIESWLSIRSAEKFSYGPYIEPDNIVDKIFSTNDAIWNSIVSINQNFINGFLTGRPIGLSFDLTALTDKDFEELKKFISQFKENREFWKNAVCHILTDTETMLVLEFRSEDFSKIEIVAFSKKVVQNNICVYPVLDGESHYEIAGGEVKSAKTIFEEGINIAITGNYDASFLTLKKQK